MAAGADDSGGVQVIARAAAILRALGADDSGLTLGQIASRVDLPRSTVQRITGALQQEGLVIAAAPGRGIRIGPGLHALAGHGRVDITEILRPMLADLAHRTGETVDLAVVSKRTLVFIDQIPGRHRLRAMSAVGESFPLHDTANGKACLALMDDDRARELLTAELGADGHRIAQVMTQVASARREGIAFDHDEHTPGVSAVGVAFSGVDGETYAISIPAPTSRFVLTERQLVDELRATLHRVSGLDVVARTLEPQGGSR